MFRKRTGWGSSRLVLSAAGTFSNLFLIGSPEIHWAIIQCNVIESACSRTPYMKPQGNCRILLTLIHDNLPVCFFTGLWNTCNFSVQLRVGCSLPLCLDTASIRATDATCLHSPFGSFPAGHSQSWVFYIIPMAKTQFEVVPENQSYTVIHILRMF